MVWCLFISSAILISSVNAFAQGADIERLSRPVIAKYNVRDSAKSMDSVMRMADSTCNCHAIVPLEIIATSLLAGVPAYWSYRAFFDETSGFAPELGLIPISWLGYMISLGPLADWTSGCEANWWHAAWIGFGSNIMCTILYSVIYGHNHTLNIYKIDWPEYAALGVAPAVIASFVYNLFLHPRPKESDDHTSDQGMFVLPSMNWDKSFALNFGMRF